MSQWKDAITCYSLVGSVWKKLFTGRRIPSLNVQSQSCDCVTGSLWVTEEPGRRADLGELVLVVCVDAEARHGSAGEAGAVRQFPHAADVTHGFVLQGGRRDLLLVLLVCRLMDKRQQSHTEGESEGGGLIAFVWAKVVNVVVDRDQLLVPTHPGRCWRCIQTPGYQSDSSPTDGTVLCSASS